MTVPSPMDGRGARGQGDRPRFATAGAGSFLAQTAAAGLGFFSHVGLTNWLGVGSYGEYVYALSWMSLAALVGAFGFPLAAIRLGAEYRTRGQWAHLKGFAAFSRRRVLLASLAASAFLVTASFAVLGPAEDPSLLYVMCASAILLPLLTASRLRASLLMGLGRIVPARVSVEVVSPALLGAGAGWAALRAPDSGEAFHGMVLNISATVVSLLLVTGFLRRAWRQVVPNSVTSAVSASDDWKRMAGSMLLFGGFNVILVSASVVLVGTLATPATAGVYAVANRVAGLLAFTLVATTIALAPFSSSLHALDDLAGLQRLVRVSGLTSLAAALAGAVGIVLFADPILNLFGPEYLAAKTALWILMAGQLVNVVSGPAMMLLNMTGNQARAARIAGGAALVNVALNLVLIPPFGPVGAAVATAFSMALWNFFTVVAVVRRLRLNPTIFGLGGG